MSQTRRPGVRAYASVMTAVLLLAGGSAYRAQVQSAENVPFPKASVHFEQNATDGDVEVVFEAKGGDDGLASLKVVAPNGRTVIDFTAPDAATLGIRQFRMESPEPKDVKSLKAAYPEGTYQFTGATFSGTTLVGKSTLSHRLPAVVKFGKPAPEAEGVPTKDVEISWTAAANAAFYIVEIEEDESGTRIQATIPGASSFFKVPNGFLIPGTEYQLGIGTVGGEGNVSFVETTFTTKK